MKIIVEQEGRRQCPVQDIHAFGKELWLFTIVVISVCENIA